VVVASVPQRTKSAIALKAVVIHLQKTVEQLQAAQKTASDSASVPAIKNGIS
jgi:hypothetical protein